MTKARNIADFKFENIVDTGTEGTKVASGTTAQRGSTTGQFRFNSTTGKFEGRNASSFVTLEVTPVVSSVNNTNITQAQIDANFDLVITGANFASGDVVKFIANDNTEYTSPTVTIDSSTQITARVPSSVDATKEPYTVQVTSTGGLAGSLSAAFNIDAAPVWSTAAGSLGNVSEGTSVNFSATATDPESDTVSYSETGGTVLATNSLTINSSTGAITGTAPSVSSDTTLSFNLRATSGTNTTDRAFSIIVNPQLDGSSAAKANVSASAIKTLTSTTTNGYYWIQASGMANPKQLWCDMNTDGGGYMRFWWFNTLEQDGGLSASWQTGTKFGIGDISTITHTQNYGYGRIPSGVTPTKLMVKGTSSDQTSSNPVSYAIWTFNSSIGTSNAMLDSMQNGTLYTMSDRDSFLPSSGNLDTHYSAFQGAGECDHWGYGTNLTGGSANESSFDLNDDNGRDNTAFSAGHDAAASGTDFFQRGNPADNATGRYLALYWK